MSATITLGMPAPAHAKLNEIARCVERGEIEASPDHIRNNWRGTIQSRKWE
jgi:hypothetical protein